MQDQESILIYAIPMTRDEQIHVKVRKYRGRHYLDLRLWYTKKTSGEFLPTKKGLHLPMKYAAELQKGVGALAGKAGEFEDETPPPTPENVKKMTEKVVS